MTSDCTTQWPDLEARLGHVFARRDLLAAAITHSSYVAENAAPGIPESQRLEFLGDAVLSLVAAEWLVAHCAGWREGTLTKVRSRLTNATTLARVARRLQLEECLRWGRGLAQQTGRARHKPLADSLEALLGALWLDGGLPVVRAVFRTWFADEIHAALAAGSDDNPKGNLQELLQKNHDPAPHYGLSLCGAPRPAFCLRGVLRRPPVGRGGRPQQARGRSQRRPRRPPPAARTNGRAFAQLSGPFAIQQPAPGGGDWTRVFSLCG